MADQVKQHFFYRMKFYVKDDLCDIGDEGYLLIPGLNTRRKQIPCDRSYRVTLKQQYFEIFLRRHFESRESFFYTRYEVGVQV